MAPPKQTPELLTVERFAEGNLYHLLQALVGMLIVARLLYPPESSVLGETLWITQGWMLGVIIWGWDAFRRNDYRLRIGLLDAALWLVVLGHGLSTLWVLAGNGNQRAALNMFWEWAGLGLSFFLLRQVLRTKSDGRRLLTLMIAVAVLLAGLGIWQHYVEFPRLRANFERMRNELGEQSKVGTYSAQQKAARLQRELAEMGVPQNAVSRSLWENRLRSTEPFATFALANTLAGFLVAWLFAAAGFLTFQTRLANFRASATWRDAGKLLCLLLIGFCLVLTKSRTAWVGFVAGLCAWFCYSKAKGFRLSRRWVLIGAGGVLAAGLFFGIAALSGGFDRNVISEAPKSLAYRLQYWTGAWEVVQEHPWRGVGPGNFRQHYLHYKLPESSEEIADPHNWVFDLWTSGGILALVGFFVLLGLGVRHLRRDGSDSDAGEKYPAQTASLSAWEIGAVLAFPLVMLVRWFAGESVELRPVWLLLGGAVAWWVLRKNAGSKIPPAGLFAGGLALLVHLLGAGGIEMPAIAQSLLILLVFLDWQPWERGAESPSRTRHAPKTALLISGLGLAAFGLCLVSATIPVWYRNVYVLVGNAAFTVDHRPLAARSFEAAATADPYSPEPAESLSELYFQIWLGSRRERDFERAVQFGESAITLDPAAAGGYRRLGMIYFQRGMLQNSAADANRAVAYLSKAVERYPNYAPLRAESAMTFELAGDAESARKEAKTALQLDQINRAAGHRDKYLPSDLVRKLNSLAK